jgi:DNA-binding response OmpR family regulator
LILVVVAEDLDTAELLCTTLELGGYRIRSATSGTEAVARLRDRRFDLVVLDLTLPDLEGLGRDRPPLAHRPPVLFLTAYDALGELLLRAAGPARRERQLAYLDLALDGSACQALRAGRALNLTPAEYRLLRYLLVNAHKVLSKEQIGRYVWGDFHGDNAIEQLVSRLRRKVDRDGPPLVHTRRGFGYRLGGGTTGRSE